jgi:hypothetical protein
MQVPHYEIWSGLDLAQQREITDRRRGSSGAAAHAFAGRNRRLLPSKKRPASTCCAVLSISLQVTLRNRMLQRCSSSSRKRLRRSAPRSIGAESSPLRSSCAGASLFHPAITQAHFRALAMSGTCLSVLSQAPRSSRKARRQCGCDAMAANAHVGLIDGRRIRSAGKAGQLRAHLAQAIAPGTPRRWNAFRRLIATLHWHRGASVLTDHALIGCRVHGRATWPTRR